MAVTVYFDGGLPANDAVPAPADGGAHARHEAEVNAALSALVVSCATSISTSFLTSSPLCRCLTTWSGKELETTQFFCPDRLSL